MSDYFSVKNKNQDNAQQVKSKNAQEINQRV